MSTVRCRAGLTNLLAIAGSTFIFLTLLLVPNATGQLAPDSPRAWSIVRRLDFPNLRAWTVAFSPDGKWIAAGAGGTLGTSGELRVWNAATGEERYLIKTPRSVRCVVFAPDGQRLVTVEHDGTARIRDAATGLALMSLVGAGSPMDSASFSPNGKLLATSNWKGEIAIWDTVTGVEETIFQGAGGQVFGVAFCANDLLVSGNADGTAAVWSIATGQPKFDMQAHKNAVHWVAAAADGKTFATAGWDKIVNIWNPATGRLAATLGGHAAPVLAVAFSRDGTLLASSTGSWSESIPTNVAAPGDAVLWDLTRRRAVARMPHKDRVFGVAISPDGKTVATACWDGSINLWQATDAAAEETTLEEFRFAMVVKKAEVLPPEPPEKVYAEDFHPDLKTDAKEIRGLRIYGPDAAECVKFEPTGLRIELPTGHPRQRAGTGVVTDFGVKGDFEITLTYEMLLDRRPGAGGNPTDLSLVVVPNDQPEPNVWHKTNQNRAVLAREVASPNSVGLFRADLAKWNPILPKDKWGNDIFNQIETTDTRRRPALAKNGRLRLMRSGDFLRYYVAEDSVEKFTLFAGMEFGAKDLRNVSVLGSTGGPMAALDVRILDLRIRADGFVNSVEPITPTTPAIPPTAMSGRLWKMMLLLVGGPLLAIVVGLVVWMSRRGSNAESTAKGPADSTIACVCAACGKHLKAPSGRAGSKVKCPQCGKPVDVPKPSKVQP